MDETSGEKTLIDTNLSENATNEEVTRAIETNSPPERSEEKTVLISSPFGPDGEVPPKGVLRVIFGNDRGREFSLGYDTMVVGRSLQCSIVLNDPSVSRKHFEVNFKDGNWVIKDLGSGNGTKVNGNKISEIVLEEGMQIEIGQTILEFTLGGEKTRAIDLSEGKSEAMTLVGQPERLEEPVPLPEEVVVEQRRGLSGPVIGIIVGGAILVLAFLGVIGAHLIGFRFFGGQEEANVGVQQHEDNTKAKEEAKKKEALILYEKGKKAFQERKWVEAVKLFEQVKALDPFTTGLSEDLQRAKDEKNNEWYYVTASEALKGQKIEEAMQYVKKIPNSSVYYAEGQRLLATIASQVVEKEIEAIRDLLKQKKKKEAKDAYMALLNRYPEDERVFELGSELEKVGVKIEIEKPAQVASASSSRPSIPIPGSVGGKGKVDYSRAFDLYESGNFSGAANELRAQADKLKGEEAKKARDMANKIEGFGAAFNEGKSALDSKRWDKAVTKLTLAFQLDNEINRSYQGKIQTMLGGAYRAQASAAYANADYVGAATSAKRALKYNPNDSTAAQIVGNCKAKANDMFNSAKALIAQGNTDEARKKLQAVISISDKGEELGRKAEELLQQLRQ